MSYIVNDNCIACLACIGNCPVNAISDAGEKVVIDAGKCIDCGVCADICPVTAIAAKSEEAAGGHKCGGCGGCCRSGAKAKK